jgi:multiple antibiotic resistance protein
MGRWSELVAVAVTLLLVMDPLGNMPMFNAILARFDERRRIRILIRELFIALAILLLFLLAGTRLLELFGLTQPSLNIAGGVLLFLIALRMIFPRSAREDVDTTEEPFIVPLAMPLVAGPSTIAILLFLSSSQPDRILEWCAALVLAWLGCTALLLLSPLLTRLLRARGMRAMERLMGMILVLIATQMLLDGIREFLSQIVRVPA